MRCLARRIVTSALAILVMGVFLAAPASAQVGSADWERAISNWAESVTDQVSTDAVGGISR